MIEKVTLVFPSLNGLWNFVRECKVNYLEVVNETFSLVCSCGESDVNIAKTKYGATIQ